MKKPVYFILGLLLLQGALTAQTRGRLGLGYDEGLAGRYFFNDRLGVQAALSYEYLGGYDATANNGNTGQNPEVNAGFSAAVVVSLFKSQYTYLDALGQVAYAFDGTPYSNDIGDRSWSFLRVALAPEFLVADHFGFGLRFGLEVASRSETRELAPPPNPTNATRETDDGTTNVRFYGPRNPFYGPALGISFFYYLLGN